MNKYSELEIMLKKERLRVEMMHKELIKDMDKMSVYQKENERLKQKVNQLETKINTYENPEDMTLMFMWCDEKAKDKIKQLETNIEEAIEYIKHSWWLRTDQTYDTSKDLKGWEVEELLSILERGKE